MYSGKKNTPASTSELGLTMRLSYNLLPDVHDDAVNDELVEALCQCLQEVSRQRLRSILILFRRQANQENCLALKDLVSILNENKVKLRSRTTKLLQIKFNKKHGLDYEALWKLMVEAQSKTGRDSVLAMHGNRDGQGTSGSHLNSVISDAQDKELLTKLHKVLQTSDGFDLQEMRAKCKTIDVTQHGLIPKKKLRLICSEYHLPVVGPLLSTLMTRCDDEKNGNISWPEFLSMLEKAVHFTNNAPTGRPKSVASSQKFTSLSASANDNSNSMVNNKANMGKSEPVKKERAPLKKQKSVTFDSKPAIPSVDSGVSLTVGQSVEMMGDDDMENEFLRSEQRRISGPSNDSMPSDLHQETSLNISEDTKIKATQEKKTKVDLSTTLPSPPTHLPGVTKKQSRPSTSRVQSAKPKPTNNRPASRSAARSAKKVKVAEGVGKASPRGASVSSAKSKEKKALAEKVSSPETFKENKSQEEEAKDEAISLNQSNNSASSAVSTTTTAGKGGITVDSEIMTCEKQAEIPENTEDDGVTKEEPAQTIEDTSSSSTLQKSASSPSIASTQISNVSHDSQDSHTSSQDQSVESGIASQVSQDLSSLQSIPEIEDMGVQSKTEVEKEPEEETEKEEAVTDDPKPEVNKLEVIVQGKQISYYIPDKYSKMPSLPDPPNAELQLDWVYGYRGNDCRGNLFEVSDGGEILYFMSNIAIIYNPTLNTQRHYTKHTAEIRSMNVHSDNITMATGQAKGPAGSEVKPMVHLWKVNTLETLLVFEDDFENAIICLAFSHLQDYLLAVDQSNINTLSVWNFKTGDKMTSTTLNTTVVCQASFHPKDSGKIISIGREHLVFWELKSDGEDEAETHVEQTMAANFENNMKAKYVISMSFRGNGDLITGDSNGTIYVWPSGGNTISHTINHAHEGPVFTLQMIGKTLVSGGRDGFIKCWSLAGKGADSNGKLLIPKQEGGIRTVLHTGNKVYIGTTINSLLSIDLKDSTFIVTGEETTNCVTQAHYEEVHCMSVLSDDQFLTGSYDGTVSLYNFTDHRPLWRYMVKGTNIHCMDVHLDTGLVALGTKDANVVILMLGQTTEDAEVNRFKLGKGAACCLKISPDGKMIAVGCQDNQILILQAHNKGSTLEMIGKFTGHSGPITGLDWSKDKTGEVEPSYLVQSSSDQIEYLIWNSKTYETVENLEEVHSVDWSSQQCLMGYPVAGIFGKEEGLEQASVDVCHDDCPLVVAGGYDGYIRLYMYPSTHSEAQFKQFAAHPHCAVCVRFTRSSQQYLLSAGSKDYTVCQWKISFTKQ
nr:echinoderm microtubule-associated protein-like 1 isoform X4 [Lytechinus pictus]